VLRTRVESDTYAASYYDPRGAQELHFPLPKTPYLKLAAVADETDGGLTLFVLNRDLKQEAEIAFDVRNFAPLKVAEAQELHHPDLKAVNTKDEPLKVQPAALKGVSVDRATVTATLKPASWNVIRLSPA
jgi:alpha-N-arabinofuranosidase